MHHQYGAKTQVTAIIIRLEKEELFKKFEEEYEECEGYWEDKLRQYGESLQKLEEEIRKNQETQLIEYQKNFENQKPKLNR